MNGEIFSNDINQISEDYKSIIDKSNTAINGDKKRKRSKNYCWKLDEMITSDGVITSLGWERLESLTKLILKKHFPKISIYKDLVHIGVVKSASVLKLDPEHGVYTSLRTYLYTCIRNEISNFLYHTHKRTKESSGELVFYKTKFKRYSIDYKYIDIVFNKLSKRLLVHKKFLTQFINVFSDSYNEDSDFKSFYDELSARNNELNLNIKDEDIAESIFEFLKPVEKQILILIVNEIKKDSL